MMNKYWYNSLVLSAPPGLMGLTAYTLLGRDKNAMIDNVYVNGYFADIHPDG